MLFPLVWGLLLLCSPCQATLTQLERRVRDLYSSFAAGELSAAEVHEVIDESDNEELAAPLINHLVLDSTDGLQPTHHSHRSRRAVSGTHSDFVSLDIREVKKISSTTVPQGVRSRSFVLGSDQGLVLMVADNQILRIHNKQITALDCTTCAITYYTDQKILFTTLTQAMDVSQAFIIQGVLSNVDAAGKYGTCELVLSKISRLADGSPDPIQVDVLNSLSKTTVLPTAADQVLIRGSVIDCGALGVVMTYFTRNKDGTNVDGPRLLYLSLQPDGQLSNSPANLLEAFVPPDGFKEGINDVKIIKIFGQATPLLVVARNSVSYIFEIKLNLVIKQITLLQKIKVENPVQIEYNADILGSFLTFIQADGVVNTYIWDNLFIPVQTYLFPHLANGHWQSVYTATATGVPSQELVAASNGSFLQFYHHVLPGVLAVLDTPRGMDVFDQCQNCMLLDLDKQLNAAGSYDYFLLVGEGSSLHYLELTVVSAQSSIKDSTDVTICFLDFESTLVEDETRAIDIEHDLMPAAINITSGLDLEAVDVTVNQVNVLGTAAVGSVKVTLNSNLPLPDISSIDYRNPNSSLSVAQQTLDPNSTNFIFKDVLLPGTILTEINENFSLHVPTVHLTSAVFSNLSVAQYGTAFMEDVLHNSLRLTGDQTVNSKVSFLSGLTVTDNTLVTESASSSTPILPSRYVNLDEENVLTDRFSFFEMTFETSPVFQKDINGILLKDIITKTDIDSSQSNNQILIQGNKNFEAGVGTFGLGAMLVNGLDFKDWYDSLIFTDVPRQTISVSNLSFTQINVTNSLNVGSLYNIDVGGGALNDVVRVDQPATITSDVTFQSNVTVHNFQSNSLNQVNPDHLLVNGTSQVISATLSVNRLYADSIQSKDINGVDITRQAARTDAVNVFEAPVEFGGTTKVLQSISMDPGVTLGGLDPSEIGPLLQHYYAPVTVTDTLNIKDDNLDVATLEVGGHSLSDFNVAGIADRFILKEGNQVLPNLNHIDAQLSIETMKLESTLDNIDILNDVVYTTGDQVINAGGIQFQGTTFFESSIGIHAISSTQVSNPDATIAGVNIQALADNIICGTNGTDMSFEGNLTISGSVEGTHITSYFDVNVLKNFVITKNNAERDLAQFNSEVVKLRETNRFTAAPVFHDGQAETTNLLVHGDIMSNTNINGDQGALLNGEIISLFDQSIVKKEGNFDIQTMLTFNSLSGSGILLPAGTFDGVDLEKQLADYVLLDNNVPILSNLTSRKITIGDTLHLNPVTGDNLYFSGGNLKDYVENNLIRRGDLIAGDKILEGTLTVHGNINVNGLNSNANHPFTVDVKHLERTSLSKTIEFQSIPNKLIVNQLEAKFLYTNEVNGVELANLCIVDHRCSILSEVNGSSVTFEGPNTFTNGLDVEGQVNSKSATSRMAELVAPRALTSVQEMTVMGDVVWGQDNVADNSLSDLFSNVVVKSSKNWADNTEGPITQIITGDAALIGNTAVTNVVISSGKVNEGLPDEFHFSGIINDSAKTNQQNVFATSKLFEAGVAVSTSLSIERLKDTTLINNVNLSSLIDSALLQTASTSSQTVDGDWILANGFHVTGLTLVGGTLDNVKVNELVMAEKNDARTIPAVTFYDGAIISGDLTGPETDSNLNHRIQTFFSNTIRTDLPEEINRPLTLAGTTSFNTLQVDQLNNIPASTLAVTGVGIPLVVQQGVELSQGVLHVAGSMQVSLLQDTIDLTALEADLLRLDRNETVANAAKVSFAEDVTVSNEVVDITVVDPRINELVTLLINNLQRFSSSLHNYTLTNIVDPTMSILEEQYVASKVGYSRVDYLEQLDVPEALDFDESNFKIVGIDSFDIGKEGYVLKVEKGFPGDHCSLSGDCTCRETRLVNGVDNVDFTTTDYTEVVYTFSFSSALFTVTSRYTGQGQICAQQNAANLVVKGTLIDSAAARLDLSGITGEQIGRVLSEYVISGLYAIRSVEMFELGGRHFLALALGDAPVNQPTMKLYELSVGFHWSESTLPQLPANPVELMRVNSFSIDDGAVKDVVHLLLVEENDDPTLKEVQVYEWVATGIDSFTSSGLKIQMFPAPGVTALEAMKVQPTEETNPQILLVVARNNPSGFSRKTNLDFLQLSTISTQYMTAFLPDTTLVLGEKPVLKLKNAMISDTASLLMATEDTVDLFYYLPNQGLRRVSSHSVAGRLVELALFRDRLPRTLSQDRATSIIYIISELLGERSTELLAVKLKGKVELPELQIIG